MANPSTLFSPNMDIESSATTQATWVQFAPLTSATLANFETDQKVFRIQTAAGKFFVPSRSYFRMRFKLKGLGNCPTFAPSNNFGASIFRSAQWDIQGQTVSRMTNHMHAVSAMETRVSRNEDWLKRVGLEVDFKDKSWGNRRAAIEPRFNNANNNKSVSLADILPGARVAGTGIVQGTYQIAVNVVTLAGGIAAINGADQPLRVGDYISLQETDEWYRISAITGAQTITIDTMDGVPANIATGPFPLTKFSALMNPDDNNFEDTSNGRGAEVMEITFQLPLSMFKVAQGLDGMTHELRLTPKTGTELKDAICESLMTHKLNYDPVALRDVEFEVQQFYFNAWMTNGIPTKEGTRIVDLSETAMSEHIINTSNDTQVYGTVQPSSYAIAIAFGDNRTTNDSRFSDSRFKMYTNGTTAADGKSTLVPASVEGYLGRLQMEYANTVYPHTQADPALDKTRKKDWRTERYIQTMMSTGQYWTETPETLQEFYRQGPYYYWQTPTDATSSPTDVMVRFNFDFGIASADLGNAVFDGNIGNGPNQVPSFNCLLFSFYKVLLRLTWQAGQVVAVSVENA